VRASWTPEVRSSNSSASIRPSAYASPSACSTTSRSASDARIDEYAGVRGSWWNRRQISGEVTGAS
jgi:hypothetical protein